MEALLIRFFKKQLLEIHRKQNTQWYMRNNSNNNNNNNTTVLFCFVTDKYMEL